MGFTPQQTELVPGVALNAQYLKTIYRLHPHLCCTLLAKIANPKQLGVEIFFFIWLPVLYFGTNEHPHRCVRQHAQCT